MWWPNLCIPFWPHWGIFEWQLPPFEGPPWILYHHSSIAPTAWSLQISEFRTHSDVKLSVPNLKVKNVDSANVTHLANGNFWCHNCECWNLDFGTWQNWVWCWGSDTSELCGLGSVCLWNSSVSELTRNFTFLLLKKGGSNPDLPKQVWGLGEMMGSMPRTSFA